MAAASEPSPYPAISKPMRILFSIITFFAAIASLAAERADSLTASRFFADAPLEVLDMIRPSSRLDMLDYYNQADSLLSVSDALGGKSRLAQVSDDYLKVEVSPVSTLEIKVLPYKKSAVYMTLYTVGSDSMARDTQVRFFDAGMRPLATEKFLKAPSVKSFFHNKGTGISDANLEEWMPFQTVVYTTGPGDTPLTATVTTLQTLPEETRGSLVPIQTPTLTAPWKGSFSFR